MSAIGSRPFARLKLSADVPFSDGVAFFVPFNVEEFISDSFGGLNVIGGFFGLAPVFTCQRGIYSVQFQASISLFPVQMQVNLVSVSGSTNEISLTTAASGAATLTSTLSANREGTEAPYPGTPAAFPTVIYSQMLISGGGAGTLFANNTKMLIEQLTVNLP